MTTTTRRLIDSKDALEAMDSIASLQEQGDAAGLRSVVRDAQAALRALARAKQIMGKAERCNSCGIILPVRNSNGYCHACTERN